MVHLDFVSSIVSSDLVTSRARRRDSPFFFLPLFSSYFILFLYFFFRFIWPAMDTAEFRAAAKAAVDDSEFENCPRLVSHPVALPQSSPVPLFLLLLVVSAGLTMQCAQSPTTTRRSSRGASCRT